jgi:hypothetical protein
MLIYTDVGQQVRFTAIPEGITDSPAFKTRTLMELCLGRVFSVAEISHGLLALDVGEVLGKASYLETIYVEPACVELVETPKLSS